MEKLPKTDLHALSENYRRASEAKLDEVKRCARTMLGCFRTGDANDPEIYVAAVVAVLCRYDVDIVRMVTDPVDGLPSRLNWLPTIAEVRAECDRIAAIGFQAAEQQARIAQQLRDRREQIERPPRLSIAELKAKYGDWNSVKRNFHAEARARLIAQVGQEAFDAIPDAPRCTPTG